MKRLLLIPAFFLFMFAKGQEAVTIDTFTQVLNLQSFTKVLEDSNHTLSIQDVIGSKEHHFARSASQIKTETEIAYWLKVTVTPAQTINKWWLQLVQPPNGEDANPNQYVDVWIQGSNSSSHQKTGYFVPLSEKSIKEAPGIERVYFSAAKGETKTIYVRVFNKNSAGEFSHLEIRDPKVGVPEQKFTVMLYVITAVALAFSLMSFFFFFFVREKAYLFFGLYTFFLSQHYLILHPHIPFISIYIPEHPQLVNTAFFLVSTSNLLTFLVFGKHFMNLRLLSRKTDRVLNAFLYLSFAAVLVNCLLIVYQGYRPGNQITAFVFILCMLAFVIRFAFFKTMLARLFVAGALWLVAFSILGVLGNFEIIKMPFNPWPVGQMGQLLIYAAGLAYKLRMNEKSRAEAEQIKNLDEIKSRFFANISHEFRTPLTLIQGPLHQIEEQVPDVEKQTGVVSVPWRQIRMMRRHTDRFLELVNQLLDLSKLDAGKMKLQLVKGDVIQVLKVLTASFHSMAERKGIHYQVHFPEQTQIVFFDKDKLDKIVSNLLGNAFKYTPVKGKVSVTVETEENKLLISVEDTGPGIAKKELDKVFDRFYQVEGNEDKGSGIGLALVKELVDLYRGQISVSSESGKGSTFRVSVPIDRKSFREDEFVYGEWKAGEQLFIDKQLEETAEPLILPASDSNQPLLLIVEDNTDLRGFIRETVQSHYQVIESVNGKEGLEKAIAEVPDVIVSDVMMPVMDGMTMVEKLKKDERTSHIPVILLTAKADQLHKIEGLETGADDYLTKPFDAKELRTRIHNLVQQRKLLRKKFAGEISLRPSEVSVNSADQVFLSRVMEAIEKNMGEEDFGVEELAREVAMSRSQLHRKLVALTNQSASEVLRNTRLQRAKQLLQQRAATPSEVAFQVGFNSHTYFSKCFKEEFGMSPSEV